MWNNSSRGKEEVDSAPPAHVWDPRALQTHARSRGDAVNLKCLWE